MGKIGKLNANQMALKIQKSFYSTMWKTSEKYFDKWIKITGNKRKLTKQERAILLPTFGSGFQFALENHFKIMKEIFEKSANDLNKKEE